RVCMSNTGQKDFPKFFSTLMRKADVRGFLSVATTSVYAMDHRESSAEEGAGDGAENSAGNSAENSAGNSPPLESGSRSRALLAELADARVARAQAEAHEA